MDCPSAPSGTSGQACAQFTAVLVRRVSPRTKLVYGAHDRVLSLRPAEELALLPAGVIAAYLLQYAGAHRIFVFRTTKSRASAIDRVPGVWPEVRLLVHLERPGAIDQVERLFHY